MNWLLGNTDSPDLKETYPDTSPGAVQRMKNPFLPRPLLNTASQKLT